MRVRYIEALIEEWLWRGDRIATLSAVLKHAQEELAPAVPESGADSTDSPQPSHASLLQQMNSAAASSAAVIAHHRHAVRQELAAKLKQVLRSATAEIHSHITDALLNGNNELAERLESERQTVQIVVSTIDTTVSQLMAQGIIQG